MGEKNVKLPVRSTDPETSEQYAEPEKLRQQHSNILMVYQKNGALSDTDLWLNYRSMFPDQRISPSGLRTRRKELVSKGLVKDTGSLGKTASGRATIIWTSKVPF